MLDLGAGDRVLSIGAAILVLMCAGGAAADGANGYAGVSDSTTDWTGLYIGGQLGGAWSDVDWTQTNANYFNTLGPAVVGSDSGFSPSGAIGGIVGGYNYQAGHWVLGLELVATASDLSETRASPFFPAIDKFGTEVNWLATVAGRVGYAWDRWLVYGRGGWTGGDVELTLVDQGASVTASKRTWANGWTLGAGAEYMLWRHVSVGLAYDHAALDLDGEAVACPACGTGVGFGTPVIDADHRVQSIMARMSLYLTPKD